MKTQTLLISGQHLTLRSSADQAHLEGLARELERRIQAAGAQGAGPMSAALMAGLGLADELSRARDEVARLRTHVEGQAGRLRALASLPASPGPAAEEP